MVLTKWFSSNYFWCTFPKYFPNSPKNKDGALSVIVTKVIKTSQNRFNAHSGNGFLFPNDTLSLLDRIQLYVLDKKVKKD